MGWLILVNHGLSKIVSLAMIMMIDWRTVE